MSNALAIAKYLLEFFLITQDCSMIARLVSNPLISKLNANYSQRSWSLTVLSIYFHYLYLKMH